MLICNIVGARPNFMKIAPVVLEMERRGIPQIFVHTGQHYNDNMSEIFLKQLGLPKPDFHLGVGSDTAPKQIAKIMIAFEGILVEQKPNYVMVGGDVNSTVAAALTASKCDIPVAHIEAGLRSFDRTMPEEINRIVTDHISESLFTTEESANANLIREGIPQEKIHFVGNCMVDSLKKHLPEALEAQPWRKYNFREYEYGLLTLHRPSNVDQEKNLNLLIHVVNKIVEKIPILFPAHPRTMQKLKSHPQKISSGLRICEPLPYVEFLGLMAKARFVGTDSGGIQEETTVLEIPCITLRENTERPITISAGTNHLVGLDQEKIVKTIENILQSKNVCRQPALWDGKASQRIVDIMEKKGSS